MNRGATLEQKSQLGIDHVPTPSLRGSYSKGKKRGYAIFQSIGSYCIVALLSLRCIRKPKFPGVVAQRMMILFKRNSRHLERFFQNRVSDLKKKNRQLANANVFRTLSLPSRLSKTALEQNRNRRRWFESWNKRNQRAALKLDGTF